MTARRGRIGLTKPFEDERQEFGRYSIARVGDANFGGARHLLDGDVDSAAFGGKLDRIRQQVPHNLLKAGRVHENQRHFLLIMPLESESFWIRAELGGLNGRFDDV